MPVKVGCASDYNKIHSDRIQKKRDEEAVVLVANNKRYGWVDFDEHITELAPGIALYETQRKHCVASTFAFYLSPKVSNHIMLFALSVALA